MAEEGGTISALVNKVSFQTKKPSKGKSDIWKSCSVVVDGDGNQQPFAGCDTCKKLLVYDGHKSGTSVFFIWGKLVSQIYLT